MAFGFQEGTEANRPFRSDRALLPKFFGHSPSVSRFELPGVEGVPLSVGLNTTLRSPTLFYRRGKSSGATVPNAYRYYFFSARCGLPSCTEE